MNVETKIHEWGSQLLDLSRRNRLLNFKESKRRTLRVQQPDIDIVFKRLAIAEKPLTVVGIDSHLTPGSDARDGASCLETTPERPRVREGEIRFEGEPRSVEDALYTLRAHSRTEMEERGVGVLYLALGFLCWHEFGQSSDMMRSPLLLVPVELERRTVLDPYRLKLRDDDIVVNPTLEKVLKEQFGIELPSIPADDSWSPREYISEIQHDVCMRPGWVVEEAAYLSVFSFLKLGMYRDLMEGLEIAKSHPVIAALAGDGTKFAELQSCAVEIQANELDDRVNPAECYQVLDADASQQQAIELVKAGASIVLQGPPGTGKSQTIANMIAELLGVGKTVLFISEKAAALDVVYRRLREAGLADAVLPLHSYRANKRDVLKELERVYQLGPEAGPDPPGFDYEHLVDRRNALNAYVRELHTRRAPLGLSVFEVIGRIAGFNLNQVPDVPVRIRNPHELTQERLGALKVAFARLSDSESEIAALSDSPWRKSIVDGMSVEIRRETDEQLDGCVAKLERLRDGAASLAEVLGLSAQGITMSQVDWLVKMADALAQGPDFRARWLAPDALPGLRARAEEASVQYAAFHTEMDELSSVFKDTILSYDLEGLAERIESVYKSPLARLGHGWRTESKALAVHTRSGKRPQLLELRALLPAACRARKRWDWMRNQQASMAEDFGEWFCGVDTDWKRLIEALVWCEKIVIAFGSNVPDGFIRNAESLLRNRKDWADRVDAVKQGYDETVGALRAISQWFERDAPTRVLLDNDSAQLDDLISVASKLRDRIGDLEGWTRLSNAVRRCEEAGAEDVMPVLQHGGFDAQDLGDAVQKRALTLWLDHWMREVPSLKDFDASTHERLIEEFRDLDDKLRCAARHRLASRIAARRPNHFLGSNSHLNSSQPSILMREAKKKRRHKPLRQLFSEIPQLLQSIKPCMMMSPLSVSQYLPLGEISFDVVIFDEASQVKPEDAVGSIMRGAQVVVVGDSKQLPPTSFFDVLMGEGFDDSDSDFEDETGAFESILDLCSTIGLREQMLRWHYRSKSEDLIAFSNRFFYDNQLVTFPTPVQDRQRTGVDFVYVPEGIYDRGGSKKNVKEADKVVDLVRKHIRERRDESLGVVALSQSQARAIDDAIWRMRTEDPSLEEFFDTERPEPFFVKNLENVQGDERDVIVLCVGYGKDAHGKMLMNFGPLNNDGGERRLNVAVTRARRRVVLVSSIKYTDIDLSRARSRGAKLLRQYLEYAERGVAALQPACDADQGAESESPFEQEVKTAIEEMGYEVVCQVGCSGYRIDLAVVHPEHPGAYVLGVECDGATYHSSATARERDRLREAVLRSLGWRLHRVWSTDWFRARSREIERLRKALDEAIDSHDETLMSSLPGPDVQGAAEMDERSCVLGCLEPSSEGCDRVPTNSGGPDIADYVRCALERRYTDFYTDTNGVIEAVRHVVLQEGPILLDDVASRVARAWGIARAGSKVRRTISSAAKTLVDRGVLKIVNGFLWDARMTVPPVRRNPKHGIGRCAASISAEEVAEAALIALSQHLALTEEDLGRATADIFGFARRGAEVRKRMSAGIQLLIESGRVRSEGGCISIRAEGNTQQPIPGAGYPPVSQQVTAIVGPIQRC